MSVDSEGDSCRDYLSQVRRAREELQAIGATAIALASGAAADARTLMAQGIWFPCLLDPDKQVYRALGIGRITLGWLDAVGWWRYLHAFLRGARQGRLHDPLQAPGLAILDAGAVARWVWRGRTLGDYPPLGAVLERLRSLPGRG